MVILNFLTVGKDVDVLPGASARTAATPNLAVVLTVLCIPPRRRGGGEILAEPFDCRLFCGVILFGQSDCIAAFGCVSFLTKFAVFCTTELNNDTIAYIQRPRSGPGWSSEVGVICPEGKRQQGLVFLRGQIVVVHEQQSHGVPP